MFHSNSTAYKLWWHIVQNFYFRQELPILSSDPHSEWMLEPAAVNFGHRKPELSLYDTLEVFWRPRMWQTMERTVCRLYIKIRLSGVRPLCIRAWRTPACWQRPAGPRQSGQDAWHVGLYIIMFALLYVVAYLMHCKHLPLHGPPSLQGDTDYKIHLYDWKATCTRGRAKLGPWEKML